MIRLAEVRVFVRSTEDPEKVKIALNNLIPDFSPKKLITREHKGIYGNVFLSYSYILPKKEAMKLWKRIISNLPPEDLEFLRKKKELMLDEWGKFHLRLSKQDLYRGVFRLAERGVVKIVFSLEAYPAKREGFLKVLEGLLNVR